MKKEMRTKIHELLDACIDSDTDVWFEYSPHISSVHVYRYSDKHWNNRSKHLDTDYLYFDTHSVRDFNKIIKKVKEYDNE